MGFYQDRVVPHLVRLSMRNEVLAPYRRRIVPAARGACWDRPLNRDLETATAGMGPLKPTGARQVTGTVETDPISDPSLRMPIAQFKERWRQNAILVVDVRDEESYKAGHIPHARPIPLDVITDHLAELRKETRPIVTYCS